MGSSFIQLVFAGFAIASFVFIIKMNRNVF